MTLNQLLNEKAQKHDFKCVKCVKFERWTQWALCNSFEIVATFQTSQDKDGVYFNHLNFKDVTVGTSQEIGEFFKEVVEELK